MKTHCKSPTYVKLLIIAPLLLRSLFSKRLQHRGGRRVGRPVPPPLLPLCISQPPQAANIPTRRQGAERQVCKSCAKVRDVRCPGGHALCSWANCTLLASTPADATDTQNRERGKMGRRHAHPNDQSPLTAASAPGLMGARTRCHTLLRGYCLQGCVCGGVWGVCGGGRFWGGGPS